jgi:hypothetical protein
MIKNKIYPPYKINSLTIVNNFLISYIQLFINLAIISLNETYCKSTILIISVSRIKT